ncbi:hypothetical protein CRE_08572 [Caenorhabditis remanei]|uniref:Uncharacterized protein n=1 Tax=Caenorhabditis remanei TaxID=31234 RepID=E3NH07_CAERE|nr:hypothetical protein CRE_08572 [Caenorhabditis remanei]
MGPPPKKNKQKSKEKQVVEKKSADDVLKSQQKQKSVESGPGEKKKSKLSKISNKKSDKSTPSDAKESGGQSKPMDGTQNGPTPNDETGNGSLKNIGDLLVMKAENCGEMDVTIEDIETPVMHDRVVRVAATDMIFDPKQVAYKGCVDNDKVRKQEFSVEMNTVQFQDPKEVEDLEKELQAACAKHELRFKNVRKNEEKNPNAKLPKSPESEKSTEKRAAPDARIKMRPDQCVLFETKEQLTEDDQEAEEQKNEANKAPK